MHYNIHNKIKMFYSKTKMFYILNVKFYVWLEHLCQLSRMIRESPGYGMNLPVSRTGDQFSQINTTLNLF